MNKAILSEYQNEIDSLSQLMREGNKRTSAEIRTKEQELKNARNHSESPVCLSLPLFETMRMCREQEFANQEVIYENQLDARFRLRSIETVLKKNGISNGNGNGNGNGTSDYKPGYKPRRMVWKIFEAEPISIKDIPRVLMAILITLMFLKEMDLFDPIILFTKAVTGH